MLGMLFRAGVGYAVGRLVGGRGSAAVPGGFWGALLGGTLGRSRSISGMILGALIGRAFGRR